MRTKSLRAKVASKVKQLRLRQKLTQEGVAEAAGFHYKYYQRIESGKVNLTLDSIGRLAKVFEVAPKHLFP